MTGSVSGSPLVSVIIPVYNVAPFLTEALDSVLRQTWTNLEIIIVGDGSTDGSGKICDRYAQGDRRVLLIHQENRGLSAARNAGLDRMSGDAVAFLDPDDAFDPSFIGEMLAAMVRESADMAVCKYTEHHTLGRMERSGREKANPSIRAGVYDRVSALRSLAECTLNKTVWNKIYRSALWKDIRFPEGHVYEDVETAYMITDRGEKVCVLDGALYLHRKWNGSITAALTPDKLNDLILAQSRVLSFIRERSPEVFPDEAAEGYQRRRLRYLIHIYTRQCRMVGSEQKRAVKNLRRQILDLGKDTGLDRSRPRTKICYHLIRFCPHLLRIASPVYRAVRRVGRAIKKQMVR